MFWMHPSFPWPEGKHSEPWCNFCVCVVWLGDKTPPGHVRASFHVRMWSYSWVHINEFMLMKLTWFVMGITVIRLSCIPEGKPGRPLSWVDTVLSLALRRDGRDRYGMRGMSCDVPSCCLRYMHCYANHAGNITTSWVDRRSSLVSVTPILASYYHSSLQ